MTDPIATFLRAEDGNLQICALNSGLRGRTAPFYEVFDCTVHLIAYGIGTAQATLVSDTAKEYRAYPDTRPVRLSQISAPVLVFINRPLESVNHFFFDELINQTMREDCGLVTGLTVDLSGKITHAGFTMAEDGTLVDDFADCKLWDFMQTAQARNTRCVDVISDEFFAIRAEHLAAVGGLAAVSSSRMPRLVRRLTLNASKRGLHVLVTPFAVATVEAQPRRQEERPGNSARQVSGTVKPTFSLNVSSCQPALERSLRRDESSYHLDVMHSNFLSERKVQPEAMSTSSVPVSEEINAHYTVWKYVIPLPPDAMMGSVGAQSIENFLVVADAWGQIICRHTPENATVMDIGCGCGRIARVLRNNSWIRKYIGFDVMRDHVQWCRNFVEPAWRGIAEFHWFDLHSETYNPTGVFRAQEFTFPAGDEAVDVIFAASVFTHLLEADAVRYLKEITRVLKPRGVALLSIHENVAPGQHFSGTEDRVDIEADYFIELAGNAGLCERENIGEFCGQRLFLLQRAE